MTKSIFRPSLRRTAAVSSILLSLFATLGSGSTLFAQDPVYSTPQPSFAQAPPALSPTELANLVAPIALYPDALLGQVLVASTYPLEVVEAQQWLQQNGNLQGPQLIDAAQQQNWDPSVQALVAFPGVLTMLNGDIRWTTDLGNAFLAQQADVMNAIQSLRAQAMASGRLANTPQLSVDREAQNGQSAIEIQPTDPQVIYVPVYDPSYVWGPPPAGLYPPLPYEGSGLGFGSLFQSAINLAEMFTGFPGTLGLRSWGWALSWLVHALFINNSFFSAFGFHNFGGGYAQSAVWVHDPVHRLGVPYAYGFAPARYGRASIVPARVTIPLGPAARSFTRPSQPSAWMGNRAPQIRNGVPMGSYSSYANGSAGYRAPATWQSRSASAGAYANLRSSPSPQLSRTIAPSSRSFESLGASRSAPLESRTYRAATSPSNPRSSSPARQFAAAQHYSQPRHVSAPRDSAPRSSSHVPSRSSGHSSHSSSKSHRG